MKFLLLLLSIAAFAKVSAQNTQLYPIVEGNKWGYIDNRGTVVIKPQFAKAMPFAQGLAPVMINGRYGYIDAMGNVVIPAIFDYGYDFANGYAIVVKNGIDYIIDKAGTIQFSNHPYSSIEQSGMKGKFFVVKNKEIGLIDSRGTVLIEPQFSNVSPYIEDGVIVVVKSTEQNYYDRKEGIIDTTGKWLVNYGTYQQINQFYNGIALVEEDNKREGGTYINAKGEEILKLPEVIGAPHSSYIKNAEFGFSCGLAIAHFYKPYVSGDPFNTDYDGVVDKTGKIVFVDKKWRDITPFSHNRAFVRIGEYSDNYILINTKGGQVGTETYPDILPSYGVPPHKLFVDGIEVVKTQKGWAVIDTNGSYVIPPNAGLDYDARPEQRIGNLVLLMDDISTEDEGHSYKYGFWDIKHNTIVMPAFYDIDLSTGNYAAGIIPAVDDKERQVYINAAGKVIWQQGNIKNTHAKALNIDYMNRGYCYVQSSADIKNLKGIGGWGGSSNGPKSTGKKKIFASNQFQMVISTETTSWYDNILGYKLYIANTTLANVELDAQDSRLYMVLQAQDSTGTWKDIEYLPSSWCGNSYHTVALAGGEYWEVAIPQYEGTIKTKIRAKLTIARKYKEDEGPEKVVYSNEIEGSINPAQFWRKPGYTPGGIMDPYND